LKAEKFPPPTAKQTPAAKQTPTPNPPSTPKVPAPSELPHPKPTPLSAVHAIPQVLVPAPSPDFMQKQQPQKTPQQKKQPSQKASDKIMKSNKPPVDYQVLLLSLADEYLNAAHRQGTQTALISHPADVEEYYKLVATGLGCLEAVLKVGFPSSYRASIRQLTVSTELEIGTSQRSPSTTSLCAHAV
jgi:hypothetical protein